MAEKSGNQRTRSVLKNNKVTTTQNIDKTVRSRTNPLDELRVNSVKNDPELRAAFENCATFHFEEDDDMEYERDSSKWPVKAVELMIHHRLRLDSAFHSPKYTKNKLWDTISDHLKEAKFNFDGKECHLKFRNMLATYKKNVEKVNIYGEECIKWKWFHAFHSVLQFKPQNAGDTQQNSSVEDNAKDEEDKVLEEETQLGNDIPKQATTSRAVSEPPETPESEYRKWSRSAVNLLLVLRHQFADIFNDPSAHKVKCWRKISKILQESGYDVNERDCIVKWHNLINTYRSNLRKSQSEHVRWEWFDLMGKILNQQASSERSTFTTVHSLPDVTTKARNSGQSQNENQVDPRNGHHSTTTVIPSEDDADTISILSDDTRLLMDNGSLDDFMINSLEINDRPIKRTKKYQRSYWKEKLKLQKAAEHRRKREWAERKQIELQKISLKKQKLKIYHRLTKTLEKLASNGLIRDFMANERRS